VPNVPRVGEDIAEALGAGLRSARISSNITVWPGGAFHAAGTILPTYGTVLANA